MLGRWQPDLSDLEPTSPNEDGANAMIRTLGSKTKRFIWATYPRKQYQGIDTMTMVNQLAHLAVGHILTSWIHTRIQRLH